MRGVLQALPFVALALAAHVALALGLQGQMGAQSSGAGGAALVSVEAAPASYAALANEWERPPQAAPEAPQTPTAPVPDSAAVPAARPLDEPAPASRNAPGPVALSRAEGALPVVGPPAPDTPQPLLPQATARAEMSAAPTAQAADAPDPAPAPPPLAEARPDRPAPDTAPPAPLVAQADPQDTRPQARPEASPPAARSAPRMQQTARGAGDGAAAGQRAEPAPAATLTEAQRNSYLASWGGSIRAQIDRRKAYPDSLRRARVGGTATVALEVGRDGRLVTAALAVSSGHTALDRAALEAVRRAGRFPTAPAALQAGSYNFSLPISFHP